MQAYLSSQSSSSVGGPSPDDAFAHVIGVEHGGRVLCGGRGLTPTMEYFGRKGSSSSQAKDDKIHSLEGKVAEYESRLRVIEMRLNMQIEDANAEEDEDDEDEDEDEDS